MFSSECGKPSFYLVDPRGAGRCEVKVIARVSGKPPADTGVFVCLIVIED